MWKAVRAITEPEQFDLGGVDAARGAELARACFEEPFPCGVPVRASFVVGAGKGGRSKYDDGLTKSMSAVLRELGFEEDQVGAPWTRHMCCACLFGCRLLD